MCLNPRLVQFKKKMNRLYFVSDYLGIGWQDMNGVKHIDFLKSKSEQD